MDTVLSFLDNNAVAGLIGSVIGSASSLGGILLVHHLNTKQSIKDEKIELYAKLQGLKISLRQLFSSRFEAYIFSDYHEARFHRSGNNDKDSIDFSEAVRWMRKSEDLSFAVTEGIQSLFEAMGRISVLYRKDKNITGEIERIYQYKIPVVYKPSDNLSLSDLDNWKTQAADELNNIIRVEYTEPIEALLAAMKPTLK